MATNKTGVTEETVKAVLAGKHPPPKISYCYTLEVYNKTPIFIPVDITEDVVESVAQKLLVSFGTIDTDWEAISLWLRERISTLHTLCFGLNKYIITCVEVDFLLDSGSTQKNDLVRSRYNLCSVWLIIYVKSQVAAARVNGQQCPYPKCGRIKIT